MVRFYTAMCVLGLILPYAALLRWFSGLSELSVDQLWTDLFANGLSTMAWADVLITAAVVITFIKVEGRRTGMTNLRWPIAGTCLVGPSFGLPLFLALRERAHST